MPIYEFTCKDCGKITEIWATLDERRKGLYPTCKHCGSRRLLRTVSSMSLSTKSPSRSGPGDGGGPLPGRGCCG